jgi:hypothetical protein
MSDYRHLVIETLTHENAALEREALALAAEAAAYREALQAALGLLAVVTDERDRAVHQLHQIRRAQFVADRAEQEATEAA